MHAVVQSRPVYTRAELKNLRPGKEKEMRRILLVATGVFFAMIVFKHDFQAYNETAVSQTKARIWSSTLADRG